MTDEQRMKAMIAFTLYTITWEVLIFGVFAFIIFTRDLSLWWFVLAAFLSANQFKPNTFKGFFKDTEPKTDAL